MRQLTWVQTTRDWMGRRRHHCSTTDVPSGLVRPSPVELNISDGTALESRLRELVGPELSLRLAGRTLVSQVPRPILLMLPDLAVRSVLLHLDQLPQRADEREALIRWRFGQEQLFPLTGTKVVFQVLSTDRSSGQGMHTVLAAAIQETVLAQYEAMAEAVGLIPLEVDVVSFRLFNLWARTTGGLGRHDEDLIWINLSDDGLTLFIVQGERLVYLRTKLQPRDGQGNERTGQAHDRARKIGEECLASLDACKQAHPKLAVKRTIVVSDDAEPYLKEFLSEELGSAVEGLQLKHIEGLGWRSESPTISSTAIPAVAGVL
ncbi:MAG: hypothetical protein ACT4OO_13800 [Nitrospiraceae bacterium]